MSTESPRFLLVITGPPRVIDRARGEEVELPLGKPLAALAYVALESTRVTRNDLASLLWPDSPPDRGRASVRQALWLLRKRIAVDAIVEDDLGELHLGEGLFGTDLHAFESLLAAPSAEALEAAWNRWQGGLLEGLAIADAPAWQAWADGLRSRWEQRFGEALEDVALRTRGDEHLAWLDRALAVRPYRESLHLARTRALLELRRIDDAEAALRRYREVVDEPDPERLRELDERVRVLRRHALEEPEDRIRTEFVGRSQEFARLRAFWQSTLSGRPRTVALVGPTGIGKSRLAAEFLARSRAEGATVVETKALDVERALDLGIAGSLVRDLLSVPGAAGISVGSTEVLEALVPSRRRRAGSPGAVPAAALADALIDLLEAAAHEAPLVLVLEDAHWADTPSRALLLRAARGLRSCRVLMLWTTRSDAADGSVLRTLRAAERAGSAAVIALKPLERTEIAELLALLLSSAHPQIDALAHRLHEASGGNPLHVVELLQALRGDGVLRYDREAGWSLDPASVPDALTLPLSVRQALEERLAHLTDEAHRLAALAALAGEPMTADALVTSGTDAGLRVAASEALTELLQRDVLRWTRDDRLVFAHDTIREAVRSRARGVGRRGSGTTHRWLPWAGAAAVLGGLTIGGWLTLTSTGLPADEPGADPGILWATTATAVHRIEQREGVWQPVDSLPVSSPSLALRVGVDVHGAPHVFGTVGSLNRGPDVVRLHGSRIDTLVAGPGDDGFRQLSPDGRQILYLSEDRSHPTYLLEVRVLDLETGESRLIHRPSHQTWGQVWHPEGHTIAIGVSEPGQPDSILLYDPLGQRTGGLAAPPGALQSVESCGPFLAVTSISPGEPLSLSLMDYEGRLSDAPPILADLRTRMWRCSPDGAQLAHLDPDRPTQLFVRDLASSDAVAARIMVPLGTETIEWTPSRAPALPVSLDLPADTVRVAWGGDLAVPVRVEHSDGALRTASVLFRTADPGIAGIRDDRLVGNAPGVTILYATAAGWLRDSVVVRVEGQMPDEALWAERFETLDPARWTEMGNPTARGTTVNGQPVLELLGDGVWMDGVYSEPVVDARQGATVELEFMLPLTDRTDRQSFTVCLTSTEPPEDPLRATGWPRERFDEAHVCTSYPGGELSRFDPSAIVIHSSSRQIGAERFPDDLPSDGWVHLGLQIGADGAVSLVLNQWVVQRHPTPAPVDRPLRIILNGRVVDTRLFVRNLIVWRGLRYR